jgi:hypothetical protein
MFLSLWQLALHMLASPEAISVVMIAAVLLAARVPVRLADRSGIMPAAVIRTAAREKPAPAFTRLRDPDAPGRTRPRAPSAAPAAA